MSWLDLFTDCLVLVAVCAVVALALYGVIAGAIETVVRLGRRSARPINWDGSDEP